jgi:hypothetical protein
MRKPRRAKLTIEEPVYGDIFGPKQWLRLTARNGEILLSGEQVSNPKRARAAIIRAMVDVLEDEGYVVTKAEEASR